MFADEIKRVNNLVKEMEQLNKEMQKILKKGKEQDKQLDALKASSDSTSNELLLINKVMEQSEYIKEANALLLKIRK